MLIFVSSFWNHTWLLIVTRDTGYWSLDSGWKKWLFNVYPASSNRHRFASNNGLLFY